MESPWIRNWAHLKVRCISASHWEFWIQPIPVLEVVTEVWTKDDGHKLESGVWKHRDPQISSKTERNFRQQLEGKKKKLQFVLHYHVSVWQAPCLIFKENYERSLDSYSMSEPFGQHRKAFSNKIHKGSIPNWRQRALDSHCAIVKNPLPGNEWQ